MSEEYRKILGLGHPRTGTGYTANLLRRWGLDVGHELLFKDGIVAWQLAVDTKDNLPCMHKCMDVYFDSFNWETIIYNLRNPKDSILSIVYTETTTLSFRNRIANIELEKNRVSMAIQSILHWDKLILDKNPSVIYRIEHDADKLYDFLKDRYKISWNKNALEAVKEIRNKRKHPDISEIQNELESVSDDLKSKINSFCLKYEYPNVF